MARLPSLTALRSFEAAARLGSMVKAGEELSVTHGAISRQVQALERDLGVNLLSRTPKGLKATMEGGRFAAQLGTAFSLIEKAVDSLQPGPVVLSCSATMTMRWLIPRLSGFHALNPNISLQLAASHGQIDPVVDRFDVALRNDVVRAPRSFHVQTLASEWIGPVCTPQFARQHDLTTVERLDDARRLRTLTRPQGWSEWRARFGEDARNEALDVRYAALDAAESFEHFYLMLQAVSCGLGVAVAPSILVTDDIRTGMLVAPFGFVRGERNLQLWSAQKDNPIAVRRLSTWLSEQIKATDTTMGMRDADATAR